MIGTSKELGMGPSPIFFDALVCFAYHIRHGSTHSVGEFPPYDARYMLRCVSASPLLPRSLN